MGCLQSIAEKKLDQIECNVSQTKNDLDNGKITVENKEEIQNYLSANSEQLKNGCKELRGQGRYKKVEQLINETIEQLNKISAQNVSHDPSKNISENDQSTSLIVIEGGVENITTLIRKGKMENHNVEAVRSSLLGYSQELSYLEKNEKVNNVNKKVDNALITLDNNVSHQKSGTLDIQKQVKKNNPTTSVKKQVAEQRNGTQLIPTSESLKGNVPAPKKSELTEVRLSVETVKNELNNPKPLTKEQSERLNRQLDRSILTLDQNKEDHLKEERSKLHHAINDCRSQIEERTVITNNKPGSVVPEAPKVLNQVETNPFIKQQNDSLSGQLGHPILPQNLNEENSKLYHVINHYCSQIEEPTVINKPEPVITEDPKQLHQQQLEAQIIADVQKKLEEIKPEITVFVGLESSKKFFELDETLIRSTLKLDDIRPDKGTDLHNNKIRLLKEIHRYSDILDWRVKETEEIEALEKEVTEMIMNVNAFSGRFRDQKYNRLEGEIMHLKHKLVKFDANPQLVDRKEACIKEIDNCKNNLEQIAN